MTCKITLGLLLGVVLLPSPALAQGDADCKKLPTHAQLKTAIDIAVAQEGSGLNLHMWATVVNRDGIVCAIAFSGSDRGAQWPGSRVISAQKANTANAFSLDSSAASGVSGGALALSTANLYSATQPGGNLFGLQASNPVATADAYKGPSDNFGHANDPLVGEKVGGVNVFGGGLGLYASVQNGPAQIVGGVGVSGDTSCADHNIAWRVRHVLELDYLQAVPGVAGIFKGDSTHPDNIIFDIIPNPDGGTGISPSGFGHPRCLNVASVADLPAVR